jgi:hypothetical protein
MRKAECYNGGHDVIAMPVKRSSKATRDRHQRWLKRAHPDGKNFRGPWRRDGSPKGQDRPSYYLAGLGRSPTARPSEAGSAPDVPNHP